MAESEYMYQLTEALCNPPQPRKHPKTVDPIYALQQQVKSLELENEWLERQNAQMAAALVRITKASSDIWARQHADDTLADLAEERGG